MSDESAGIHEGDARIRAYLDERNRLGQFTGSALIRSGDRVVVDTGYGDAERLSRQPNTPQTAFQICSVSKQCAAAAILMLQEHGALSVDDRICTWISGCPPAWEPITVHHLLTHTSGIGHWFDFPGIGSYQPGGREELVSIFQAQD